MKVLVRLSVETWRGGLVTRQEQEQLLPPEQVTVLNEHGDVTLGQGRKAQTYMAREIREVVYLRHL